MTEETKQRLLERFEQILNATDKKPRTINDIEEIALQIRDQVAQVAVEEISHEASSPQDQEQQAPSESEVCSTPIEEKLTKVGCCNCPGTAWYKGERSRRIVTLAGEICLTRRYFYCRRCNTGFCPMDTRLTLPQGSSFTDAVSQEIAYLSACLPFEQATKAFSRLARVCLSARSAQRLCLTKVRQQVESFLLERDLKALPQAFAPLASLSHCSPKPIIHYVAADGIQTPMQEGSWKEMKVGVVRSEHRDGRQDQASRYVNHLGDAKRFGNCLESLAIDCGSLTAQCLVFLGDGAPWLWNLASTHFPRAIQILDFWHALEYVGKVARERFPEPEQTLVRNEWLSSRASEMKKSDWVKVHQSLESVRSLALESVTAAVRYFSNNASRMDYKSYLKRGLCIGSGVAESACKRLVTQRLKGSGMHWSEKGAQVICSLRCLLLGGEWDAFVEFWNRQLFISSTPIPSPLL